MTSTVSSKDWTTQETKREQTCATQGERKFVPDTVITLDVYAKTGVIGTEEMTGSAIMRMNPFKRATHCTISIEQLDTDVLAFRTRVIDEALVTRQNWDGEPHTKAEQLQKGLKFSPLTVTVPPGYT